MNIVDALILSVIAMLIIMAVLLLLMGLIYLMSWLLNIRPKNAVTNETDVPILVPKAEGSCGSVKLFNVCDRDAALIMAIVADELQTPLNELRFVSIKQVDEAK